MIEFKHGNVVVRRIGCVIVGLVLMALNLTMMIMILRDNSRYE